MSTTPNYSLKHKLDRIIKTLGKELIEREEALRLAILCAFSNESIFLLGLPGIGKSLIARKLTQMFKEAKSFEVLMSKYTAPEEIFGPIDISKLKDGSYKRKTDNYLPVANIAFLDEIWKASSSIQNTLLTITNEKIFVNDGIPERVNLYLVIAASNELPERNQGLEALWDRFIMRMNLLPIQNENKFFNMITNQQNLMDVELLQDDDKLELSDIDNARKEAKKITFTQEIFDFISEFKKTIKEFNDEVFAKDPYADLFDTIYISDRK